MATLAVGHCAECGVEFAVLPNPLEAEHPSAETVMGATAYAANLGCQLVVSRGREFNCPGCGTLNHLSDEKQFLVDHGGGKT